MYAANGANVEATELLLERGADADYQAGQYKSQILQLYHTRFGQYIYTT